MCYGTLCNLLQAWDTKLNAHQIKLNMLMRQNIKYFGFILFSVINHSLFLHIFDVIPAFIDVLNSLLLFYDSYHDVECSWCSATGGTCELVIQVLSTQVQIKKGRLIRSTLQLCKSLSPDAASSLPHSSILQVISVVWKTLWDTLRQTFWAPTSI